ncbi:MAG TPA: GtrA family protein [Candidatus Binatia bacterium]|jgi:putative flippase GtrA
MKRLPPPLMVSLRRSQVASLTATLVDFSTMVFLTEVAGVWYVAATATGAFIGAVVNFLLGRHWTFTADHEAIPGQVIRYAVVSAVSLGLNTAGVYLLTDYAHLHYALSRVIVAMSVGLLFNFPLHRHFVFNRQTYA